MKLNKITSALVVAGLACASSVALAYDTPVYTAPDPVTGTQTPVPYDNAVTQSYNPGNAAVAAAIAAGGGVRNPLSASTNPIGDGTAATTLSNTYNTPSTVITTSTMSQQTTIASGTTGAVALDGQLVKGVVDLGTGQQSVTLYDTPVNKVGQGTVGGANGPSGMPTVIVGAGTGYATSAISTSYLAVDSTSPYTNGYQAVGTNYVKPTTTGAAAIPVPAGVTVIAGGVTYAGSGTIPLNTTLIAGDTFAGVVPAAGVVVQAPSKVGGVASGAGTALATPAAPVTIPAGTILLGGDKLVTTQVQIAAGTYLAGSVINGAKITVDTTYAAAQNAKAGDFVLTGAALTTATGNFAAQNTRPGSGIINTRHDFFKSANAQGSVGLCTFCHTPHKAAATLLLWNHTMSSNNFAWEVAATTAGTALPGFTGNGYAGPSAKCMACHDGTVAYGDVGWFKGSKRNGASALNTSKMGDATNLVGTSSGNLAGNHPVAIPYPYQGAPNVYNGSKTGARLATNDFVLDPTGNGIRLYTDLGGSQIVGKATPGKSGMECTSCHDPHNKAAVDTLFLRGKLVGASKADGYICAQCHSK